MWFGKCGLQRNEIQFNHHYNGEDKRTIKNMEDGKDKERNIPKLVIEIYRSSKQHILLLYGKAKKAI